MAGLDPAIQQIKRVFRRADARRLVGRLKGGHDELGDIFRASFVYATAALSAALRQPFSANTCPAR
jgi:hypothetical protein